ncbi:Hsp70 family protein [Microlunatus speluncae]|uniref:Hsp70 family protein n=1 Tax=Microlunatus speluncae TaxID=2594267 RepID=UPI0012665853|nr:Hsp70 family protein [Microlunatus speluncae]
MSRSTIDFGIDLGTTNSAVAVLHGVQANVIKNNDGQETTPSAVWVDKRDRLYVGRAARERSELDPANTSIEFKLQMGTAGEAKKFDASGRSMTPEELSAEVLKSLRADVRQSTGDDLDAAVITVPAAFDMGACDATRRAAELAGLRRSPLLQEPTAAALAYGFQAADDKALWLVYDFGGGTFDAAVIQLRDGEFSVINHRGDNFLGGKLIDWKIVDELLVPAVASQLPGLSDLRRGNPRWFGVVNKLKLAAETAKIRLSRADSADVIVELDDGAGRRHEFEYELRRADVERLTEPLVVRSINLCRKALQERALGPADIEQVIMVGGQTLMPYLRERIADPRDGLGIRLEHGQDPMTVVARGAAIFAGGQRVEATADAAPASPDAFAIQFEYQPVGPDTEPLLAGKVTGPDGALPTGLAIELVNAEAQPPWRSGKITIPESGVFGTSLWAERGRKNTFAVELTDATGAPLSLTQDRLSYTVGSVETDPPLAQSIGVGLDGNQMLWLIERGTGLPVRRRVTLRSTVPLQVGERGGLLRIPVLEGEHGRADRNRRIGRLEVRAAQVSRNVPVDSEIEFRIEIDASRLIRARAYLPILDQEFEDIISLGTESAPSYDDLSREVEGDLTRLAELRDRDSTISSPVAGLMLERIRAERIEQDLDELLDASKVDPDAAAAAQQRILDLRAAVDDVENELEWPTLVADAETRIAEGRDLIASYGSDTDQRDLPLYVAAVEQAVESRDADLLRQRLEELQLHVIRAMERHGILEVHYFDNLADSRAEMRNRAHADRLIAEGQQAIDSGDYQRLRGINLQLATLIPDPPPPPDPFSTVSRTR